MPGDPPPLLCRMAFSACGGMGAASVCHPLDVVRVAMQLQQTRRSALNTARHIVAASGTRGLYSGLSAAFLRQWTYGSCRVGIFSWLLAQHRRRSGAPPIVATRMGFGVTSGTIGAAVGTPSELALVRMSADARLPAAQRRAYRGVADCLSTVAREEGVAALWRGSAPTMARAGVVAGTSLGLTSELKARVPPLADAALGPGAHPLRAGAGLTFACANVCATFCATAASQPFDVVKSRVQDMRKQGDCRGAADCARRVVREEGPMALMRGFTPAWAKLAPYSMISLYLTERITQLLTGHDAL